MISSCSCYNLVLVLTTPTKPLHSIPFASFCFPVVNSNSFRLLQHYPSTYGCEGVEFVLPFLYHIDLRMLVFWKGRTHLF